MPDRHVDLRPWEVLETREVYRAAPFVRVSVERVRLPNGQVVQDFHQVHMQEYALVVVRDTAGRVLLLRSYKHGTRRVGLHLPGGNLAPNEPALTGVQRELREEAGMVADNWRSLGSYVCGANQGCGRAHFYAAENARRETAPNAGDLEEMQEIWLTPDEVAAAVRRGEVDSLGTISALALVFGPFH